MKENLYKVKLGPYARADLREIGTYYRNQAGDRVADEIMGRIYKDLSILKTFPRIGPAYEREKHRIFLVYEGRYVALYVPDEKRRLVGAEDG